MRVPPEKIHLLLKKQKDVEQLKEDLKLIFSYPENIDSFSKFIFPHAIKGEVPSFHQEIYQRLFQEGHEAIVAPRGHGKSTITGLIFIVFCIVNKLEKYIVYVSQNHAKTVQFLAPLRHEFKNNKDLQWLYGDLTPKASKDDDGKDREDCFDVNGIRIEAVSFEKNLRGFKYLHARPSLIVLDDIEDDMRVLNPELRRKDADKLNKIIIPSLDIKGKIKFIGTLLHQDSLLKKKLLQYNGIKFQACDIEFQDILWEQRFTKERLIKIKQDIGSLPFAQEYLNDPVDTASSLIKPEWVRKSFREDISAEDLQQREYSQTALGVDFAFSDRVSADESAFVSVGAKDDYYYIFDCRKKKGMSVGEQMIEIKTILHKKYRYNIVAVEENSIRAVSKDLHSMNLPLKLFWTSAKDPAKKQVPQRNFTHKRHTVGKFNLIQRLATQFENGRIIIPYKTDRDKETAELILAECISYALSDGKIIEAGVHPDIPIGLGYAIESLTMSQSTFFLG